MSAILVHNISAETRRALKARAKLHGRSTEAEIRAILEGIARPASRVKVGSALAALAKPLGGINLRITRDKTPAKGADLE